MRVLIYSECPQGQAILAREREAGNHASLRDPQFFRTDETEQADLVWCFTEHKEIAVGYQDRGIAIRWIENAFIEPEPEAEQAAEAKPKTRRRK